MPGDFSSAAFFIVAGCIAGAGPLVIEGVGVNPTRTGLLELLSLMGADLRLINHRNCGAEPVADIEVRPAPLQGIDAPARLVPLAIDELPAFFVAAACASGVTTVSGAAELRVKESDRIAAMARGLAALGIRAEPRPDGIRIEGGRLTGGVVESRRRSSGRDELCGRRRFARRGRSRFATSPMSRPRSPASPRPPAASASRSRNENRLRVGYEELVWL